MAPAHRHGTSIALPAFYSAPAGVARLAPGTLLRHQAVPAPGVDANAFRVMYTATNQAGTTAAVTGLVYVPQRRPPPGGFPLVSWAHPTNGMADPCTPSLDAGTAIGTGFLNAMLDRGWEVAATDYQGEGTPPGIEPYLVGDVEAADALDVALAARHLPAAHAGRRLVVWGYSQGGQTALFAWELGGARVPAAPTLPPATTTTTTGTASTVPVATTSAGTSTAGTGVPAPASAASQAQLDAAGGLRLVGVVAGAPPWDLAGLLTTLAPTANRYLLLMALAGLHLAYGDRAPLGAVLDARGTRLLPELRVGCTDALAHTIDAYPFATLLRAAPGSIAGWRAVLQADSPLPFAASDPVPLLVVQGTADPIVPAADSLSLARGLCGPGRSVTAWTYPRQTHITTLGVSAGDVRRWIAARFAGDPGRVPAGPALAGGTAAVTCEQ